MAIEWKAEYDKAVALEEDGRACASTSTLMQMKRPPVDTSIVFLDLLLMQEGGEWWMKFCHRAKRAAKESQEQKVNAPTEEDKKQLMTLKKRLAAVGSELLVKLPELNVSLSSKETSRSARVQVLRLQLLCRMLCFGTLTSKRKEEKKQLRKEIRGLLDRIALLLDAANPPSLADEDADERSPFQEFLQKQLSPRLQTLLPELMQYLMRVYELEEENSKAEQDVKGAMKTMLLTPVVKLSSPLPELPTSAVIGNRSILSALRQERPVKRARPDASGLFKEVELPYQLQQKHIQSHSRKSRRVSKSDSSSANKSTNTNRSSSYKSSRGSVPAGAKSIKASSTTTALTNRLSDGIDLLRSAAAKTPTAPRLPRIMSESSHIARLQTFATQVGQSAPGRTQSASVPGSAIRRKVNTSSVVMRTPDRPKRLGSRCTRRVLVEASPPLRRSTGASAPHHLQSKSSRPGANPSPLFG